ncbi:MAG TPA: efflux RND transporter periplasmic adaptor subunit [Terrimicrobiaceae bacterium]|nr:efflux RND transporter periplasmic adaptor subunit [Terrimicrobiaceae bacterium]
MKQRHLLEKSRGLRARMLWLFLGAAVILGCSKPVGAGRRVSFYQSPMHPWITSSQPGNCTICGMALVPVYEGETGKDTGNEIVSLGEASANVLDVATVPARRIDLKKTLRFSGILEDDENLHRVIAAYYDGRIDQIQVNHVGQYVEKGQPLASIYSPELLYVVREFQNALKGGNDGIARNAAQRLVQYGLSSEQVAGLAKQPETVYTIDLLAPISGTVITRKAAKGQYIKTGEMLFEMGDLSRLWFHAEVYERDLPDLKMGQKAVLRSPTVPDREFEGTVTFIDPNFDERTRSTKVRIEVENPEAAPDSGGLRRLLPHRAYAEADLTADLGAALVVPRSAVLRDGRRSVAYVETSAGRYEQRSVRTGRVGDEGIEILDGLAEGEQVVTQGNLMIDAEAQLRHGTGVPSPKAVEARPAVTPAPPEARAFLDQLAKVSEALATDDMVAAVTAGSSLRALANALPALPSAAGEDVAPLRELSQNPGGADLKAVRRSFLPWSQAGSALALALARSGVDPGVRVFVCPMTGDSFPGAPAEARWVQTGAEARNPYLGTEMLSCGGEVTP